MADSVHLVCGGRWQRICYQNLRSFPGRSAPYDRESLGHRPLAFVRDDPRESNQPGRNAEGIAPKRSANKKNPEVESCQAGWGATSGVAVSAVARSWNFLRLLIAGAPGACPPCLPMFLEKSSIARRTVNSTMKAAGHE
jgi:hypothetical protein